MRRYAVIAREHQDVDTLEPRRRPPLPLGEPRDDLLQAAETGWRLGELRLAARDRDSGVRIAGRQVDAGRPQVGKGA